MPLTRRPCAYCGRTDLPRERGHVIPKSMYPSGLDPRIQRPTIAECMACKQIWQDDEAHFRAILLMAGESNAAVLELWEGPVRGSFDKDSGPRWVRDLHAQMVPFDTEAGRRHLVYPARDPRVMKVIRKIFRGLCHYHGLGTTIRDRQVFANIQLFEVPERFRPQFVNHSLGDHFCRYAFLDMRGEGEFHSAWTIEFFGRTNFLGLIAADPEGWPPDYELRAGAGS